MKQRLCTALSLAIIATALTSCTHVQESKRKSVTEKPHPQEPAVELGDKTWGIASVSVASGREHPENMAELGTQILMGHVVRLWEETRHWTYVQSVDGYYSWLEKGSFVQCDRQQAESWKNSPLLIVTAIEDVILERAEAGSQPVSDVVIGDLVKKTGEEADWLKVELPDKRAGFLPKKSAQDYGLWKQSRRATPENIERTARMFLGRPYLWGGNSSKALDCSGFAKLVFFLNGIELNRNASQQALQGEKISVDENLSQLRKGDLLMFGFKGRGGRPERVTHVGIYLGDKTFMQSSERVRLSSLDPDSPIRDEFRIRSLLYARRILPESGETPRVGAN